MHFSSPTGKVGRLGGSYGAQVYVCGAYQKPHASTSPQRAPRAPLKAPVVPSLGPSCTTSSCRAVPSQGGKPRPTGNKRARATPRRANGSPFRFRFPKKSGPPHFQNSVKASTLWFHFDVDRTRLRTERTMATKCWWWVQARQMTAAATQRASSAMVRFVSIPHPAQT
jgi:hypothetical protein